jgi:hypothetical protein
VALLLDGDADLFVVLDAGQRLGEPERVSAASYSAMTIRAIRPL